MERPSIFVLLLVICIICANILYATAFADWMTKDYCDRHMEEGEIIMNEEAISSIERYIKVFRAGIELHDGSVYIPGEKLEVSLSVGKDQYVFEVHHARFSHGGCNGMRIANKPTVELLLPSAFSKTPNVQIVAGWSEGHNAVKITPTFNLFLEPNPKYKSKIVKSESVDFSKVKGFVNQTYPAIKKTKKGRILEQMLADRNALKTTST